MASSTPTETSERLPNVFVVGSPTSTLHLVNELPVIRTADAQAPAAVIAALSANVAAFVHSNMSTTVPETGLRLESRCETCSVGALLANPSASVLA